MPQPPCRQGAPTKFADPATPRTVDLAALQRLEVDDLLLFVPAGPAPLAGVAGLVDWQACGALSAAIEDGRLDCSLMVRTLMPAPKGLKARRLLLTGLGSLPALRQAQVEEALREAVAAARTAGARSLVAAVPALGGQVGRREALALALLFVRAAASLPALLGVTLLRAEGLQDG